MLSDLLGLGASNPKKLPLININPTQIQSQTIAGNLQNAPAAFDLASMVNQFNVEELNKQLERMMPGYASLRDSATGVAQSQIRGEIPKDVERLLGQRAAEKGVTLGTSGSGFQGNDLLRNLGLTSLDMTQRGLDSASRWIASMPKAPTFDFTSMFFTPQQRLSFALQQAQANLPIRSFNNWVDTLPSVQNRALGEFMDWIENTGRSVVEAYAGMATGGKNGPSASKQTGGISQTAGYSTFAGGNGMGASEGGGNLGGAYGGFWQPSGASSSFGNYGSPSFANEYGSGVSPYGASSGLPSYNQTPDFSTGGFL